MTEVSWVKALQEFFSDNADGYGRKIATAEFKMLTAEDKTELRDLLIAEGREVSPLKEPA